MKHYGKESHNETFQIPFFLKKKLLPINRKKKYARKVLLFTNKMKFKKLTYPSMVFSPFLRQNPAAICAMNALHRSGCSRSITACRSSNRSSSFNSGVVLLIVFCFCEISASEKEETQRSTATRAAWTRAESMRFSGMWSETGCRSRL